MPAKCGQAPRLVLSKLPTGLGRGLLLGSLLVLLNLIISTYGSRRFLTGLIIGTLIARNNQHQGSYPSYPPMYQPPPMPPSYPSGHSNSNQPLLIIIPTAGGSSKSSHKAQPSYQMAPPAYPEEAPYQPPMSQGHSNYSDRASRRRMVSHQSKAGPEKRNLQKRFMSRILDPADSKAEPLARPKVRRAPEVQTENIDPHPEQKQQHYGPVTIIEPEPITVAKRRTGDQPSRVEDLVAKRQRRLRRRIQQLKHQQQYQQQSHVARSIDIGQRARDPIQRLYESRREMFQRL